MRGLETKLAELRERLARDASTAWAAYVVGSLAVLMHEEGVSFEAGMSFIVRSDVPEGKGVSSSAAVEVGLMACGLSLPLSFTLPSPAPSPSPESWP